jgi:hypothetical protein
MVMEWTNKEMRKEHGRKVGMKFMMSRGRWWNEY